MGRGLIPPLHFQPMKTTTIYKTDAAGEVEKIEVEGARYAAPSHDSMIDMPMHQRVLETYRKLEANGKLGPNDCERSKTFTKRIWEREAARLA